MLLSCSESKLSITVSECGGTLNYTYHVNKEIADEYFGAELPQGLLNCEVDEVDGIVCYVYSESASTQSFSEFETKLCNINLYGEDNMNIFSFASISDRTLRLSINPFVTEDIKDIALIQGVDIQEIIKLSLTITMPYEIESFSEGNISTDKRSLTLELSNFDAEKDIEVICVAETNETVPIYIQPEAPSKSPLILVGILIILTVSATTAITALILIKKKKRKEAEAMPETPIDKF